METYVILILFAVIATVTPIGTKKFRSDYSYNSKTDAFYKLHIEQRRSWSASEVCGIEGAKLMVPETQFDLSQLHGMLKSYPDLGNYVWVASDGQHHESAEEKAIIEMYPVEEEIRNFGSCNVVTRDGKIEDMPCTRMLPFMCKVTSKEAPYDSRCGTYSLNYEYIAATGSCYKVSKVAYSWNEAYSECRSEGAHLVIINSAVEKEVVQNLTNAASRVQDAKNTWFFHAGFRANEPRTNETLVFKTIFNQTLEEAGYNEWSPNEPNNAFGREYCGTIFKNDGKFNDVECSHVYAFVCEKEMHV